MNCPKKDEKRRCVPLRFKKAKAFIDPASRFFAGNSLQLYSARSLARQFAIFNSFHLLHNVSHHSRNLLLFLVYTVGRLVVILRCIFAIPFIIILKYSSWTRKKAREWHTTRFFAPACRRGDNSTWRKVVRFFTPSTVGRWCGLFTSNNPLSSPMSITILP